MAVAIPSATPASKGTPNAFAAARPIAMISPSTCFCVSARVTACSSASAAWRRAFSTSALCPFNAVSFSAVCSISLLTCRATSGFSASIAKMKSAGRSFRNRSSALKARADFSSADNSCIRVVKPRFISVRVFLTAGRAASGSSSSATFTPCSSNAFSNAADSSAVGSSVSSAFGSESVSFGSSASSAFFVPLSVSEPAASSSESVARSSVFDALGSSVPFAGSIFRSASLCGAAPLCSGVSALASSMNSASLRGVVTATGSAVVAMC